MIGKSDMQAFSIVNSELKGLIHEADRAGRVNYAHGLRLANEKFWQFIVTRYLDQPTLLFRKREDDWL